MIGARIQNNSNYTNCFKYISDFVCKRPLFASFLINVALYFLFFTFSTPGYNTNDDPYMMMLSSGFWGGVSYKDLGSMNVFVGIILNFFYTYFSGVNCYVAFLYLVHFISTVTVLFCFIKCRNSLIGIIAFLLIFVSFNLPFIASIQFTTTAFVAIQSGIVLFLTFSEYRGKSSIFVVVFSLCFILFGTAIRSESFYLLFLLILPLFVIVLVKEKRFSAPSFYIVSILLFVLLHIFNFSCDEGHGERKVFFEFVKYGRQVFDYNLWDYSRDGDRIYKLTGWSRNDFDLLNMYVVPTNESFSTEKFKSLGDDLRVERDYNKIARRFLRLGLQYCLPILGAFLMIFLVDGRRRIYLVGIYSPVVFLLLYFSYIYRTPTRVIVPLISALASFSFLYLAKNGALLVTRDETYCDKQCILGYMKSCKMMILATVIALFSIYSALQVVSVCRQSVQNKKYQVIAETILEDIKADADHIYVDFNVLQLELLSPFDNLNDYHGAKILFTGWSNISPAGKALARSFGIDGDIFTAIFERDDMYLIMDPGNKSVQILEKYYKEHNGINVRLELIKQYDRVPTGTIGIYKMKKENMPNHYYQFR